MVREIGRPVVAVEVTAGVDQFGELGLADRDTGDDGADEPGFLFEVPNKFAAGGFTPLGGRPVGAAGKGRPWIFGRAPRRGRSR
jgi:hypothetical protein